MTRAIVTALLLLAVSPVTAPFLTIDAGALLGEETPLGAAVVQSKKAHDEPVPAMVSVPQVELPVSLTEQIHGWRVTETRTRKPAHVPLRL